jgi:outer membrane protein assembly factor BamA
MSRRASLLAVAIVALGVGAGRPRRAAAAPDGAPATPADTPATLGAPAPAPAAPGATDAADATDAAPAAVTRDAAAPAEGCSDDGDGAPATDATLGPPVTWSEWQLAGTFVEDEATLRAMLEPTMRARHALTATARQEIAAAVAALGYHQLSLTSVETRTGGTAVLQLAPLPIVRSVAIDVEQSFFDVLLDDEISRRMRLRPGTYLPYLPGARDCALIREQLRIEEYLRDEGFFEAKAHVNAAAVGGAGAGVRLRVKVELGPAYDIVPPAIPNAGGLALGVEELRDPFKHGSWCFWKQCLLSARFTRAQHQADLQKLLELYHRRGFPAARVTSDFDPRTSFDRRTKTVKVALHIDQRRQLDVVFEGNDEQVPSDQLRDQLTFDKAGSADDYEAQASAQALLGFLQARGFFDAKVTWSRERFVAFDRLVYRIVQGEPHEVRDVAIVGTHALSQDAVDAVLGTEAARSFRGLFGANPAATAAQLAADVDRVTALYRREGYRDAKVAVAVAPTPAGLDSVALTAAQIATGQGGAAGELYVRFTIDEGAPTTLHAVEVAVRPDGDTSLQDDGERALCDLALRHLADALGDRALASHPADRCRGAAPGLRYHDDQVTQSPDGLRDALWNAGRPRAVVELAVAPAGDHAIIARYQLRRLDALKVGKVILRGNFRTRPWVLRDQLGLTEGTPLTADKVALGARQLRATGLFNAVNVDLIGLDTTTVAEVNAVVRVEERYDPRAQIDFELGYSSYSGFFAKVKPAMKNLLGLGMSLDTGFTEGTEISNYEGALRLPKWMPRYLTGGLSPLDFVTDLSAFYRRQKTPRFGELTTKGATVALPFAPVGWQRLRSATQSAWTISFGPRWDYRLRQRQIDALRPVGADGDQTQVPIDNSTGSIGVGAEWEARVDRSGSLSPLAPASGFRLEGQVSWAEPFFLGDNRFIKLSASGQKYWPVGDALIIRTDLKFDQGIPLGGASLLPDVERFFAGGDTTVRGYQDDRFLTEVVRVAVPPIGNITQYRLLPAGGNIRVLGSVDAQVRLWKFLAGAMFTDAGMINNRWSAVTAGDFRPSIGMGLRALSQFGAFSIEYAMPLRPRFGDDPRGRYHIGFALRF